MKSEGEVPDTNVFTPGRLSSVFFCLDEGEPFIQGQGLCSPHGVNVGSGE